MDPYIRSMHMKNNARVALAVTFGTIIPLFAMAPAGAVTVDGVDDGYAFGEKFVNEQGIYGHWEETFVNQPVACDPATAPAFDAKKPGFSSATPQAWVLNSLGKGTRSTKDSYTKDQIKQMQVYDATGKNSAEVCYLDSQVYYLTGKLTNSQEGLEPSQKGAGQWHLKTVSVPGEPKWVEDEDKVVGEDYDEDCTTLPAIPGEPRELDPVIGGHELAELAVTETGVFADASASASYVSKGETFPEYSPSVRYSKGDTVMYLGVAWVADSEIPVQEGNRPPGTHGGENNGFQNEWKLYSGSLTDTIQATLVLSFEDYETTYWQATSTPWYQPTEVAQCQTYVTYTYESGKVVGPEAFGGVHDGDTTDAALPAYPGETVDVGEPKSDGPILVNEYTVPLSDTKSVAAGYVGPVDFFFSYPEHSRGSVTYQVVVDVPELTANVVK